jgi:hypothetical protein
VNDAEDRGVRADPDGEGQHYDGDEERRSAKTTQGVSNILNQHVSMLLGRGYCYIGQRFEQQCRREFCAAPVPEQRGHLGSVLIAKLGRVESKQPPINNLDEAADSPHTI